MGSEGDRTSQKAPTLITVVNKKTVNRIKNTEKCNLFLYKIFFSELSFKNLLQLF